MTALRHVISVCAGYLVQELLLTTAGISAAIASPSGYFEYFGKENLLAALGIWSFVTFAVPQFLIAVLLAWICIRLLGTRTSMVVAFLTGVVICWLGYMAFFPGPDGQSQLLSAGQFFNLVRQIYFENLWQLPSSWASWLGLVAGIWLARRKRAHVPQSPRTEA
ncbi:MAG: hypothetical protein IPK97_11160 [Ahniella sp.]|nr:hypothetical protein [Ahniella sp.]